MKNLLREQILNQRELLDKNEHRLKSDKIFKLLKKKKIFIFSKKICLYVDKGKEVTTKNIILYCIQQNKNVFLPFINSEKLFFSKINSLNDLVIGKFNILEPKDRFKTKEELDLIIVPGLVFDKKGNRIGHGKGYYDSFLKKHPNATKIGLAFEDQINKKFLVEDHDIPMDFIITEKRIINCSKL